MNREIFKSIRIVLFLVLVTSCASRKEIVYFQNLTDTSGKEINNDFDMVFQPYDLLVITVSSADMMGLEPFNLPAVAFNAIPGSVTGEQKQLAYRVNKQGAIFFPILGEVGVAGLTRTELTEFLKNKLSEYIKNPLVHIELANFTITVLGEVNNPGTFTITNERISIIEALGLAGDMSITGKRNDVLVIREKNGKRQYHRIDITSSEVFNSPVYYLKQNDAIYVSPNNAQIKSSSYNKNTPIWISVTSVILSLGILLTR